MSSPRRPWPWYSMPWEPQIEIQREVSSSSLKALFCCYNFETSSKTILGPYQMSTLFTFYSQRGPELTLKRVGKCRVGTMRAVGGTELSITLNLMGWSHCSKFHPLQSYYIHFAYPLLKNTIHIFFCDGFWLFYFATHLDIGLICQLPLKLLTKY